MEQEKYCFDGISDGPDVPWLIQSPSLTLKATYYAFEYFILGTGQGLHSACKIFFFNDSSRNSNRMFAKFGKTGPLRVLFSSTQSLLTAPFCLTQKQHVPLISNPVTAPQGKAFVSLLYRWETGFRGFKRLASHHKANPKRICNWTCLSFWGLMISLPRPPARPGCQNPIRDSLTSKESRFPQYAFSHEKRLSISWVL